MSSIGDLCDQGRCAQILRHIAEHRLVEKVAERNAEAMAAILTDAGTGLGMDMHAPQVRQAVADAIGRYVDSKTIEGSAT